MKKLFILFVLFVCWSIEGFAEADSLSNYKIIWDNQVISFVNKETGESINTFDLKVNNPYENLSYPSGGEGEQGFQSYDLRDVDREELFTTFLPGVFEEKKPGYSFDLATTLSYQYVTKTSPNYAVVSYTLFVIGDHPDFEPMAEEWITVAAKSTVVVLNAKGEEVFRLNDFNMDCTNPILTNNGKYLAFRYANDDLRSLGISGFKVYDIAENMLIVNRKLEKGYRQVLRPVLDRYNRIRVRFEGSKNTKFFVYDLEKRIVYTKVYPRTIFRNYSFEIQSEGFVFRNPPKPGIYNSPGEVPKGEIIWIDKFETDFEKEEF